MTCIKFQNKMKVINIILSLLISAILYACGEKEVNCHKTINFNNNTFDTVYVAASYQYPDTLSFKGIPNPKLDPNHTKVLPGETNSRVLWRRDCIELAFKDLIASDTLMIYVFDANTIETTPWDSIKTQNLIFKRYDLSLSDLQQMGWSISYP